MIPILYDKNEMSFQSNGICRLSDIISCKVTEERNGVYECEFTYPVSGLYFSEITEGRIIACYHDDTKTIQPFDIYSRSQPLNNAVTFYAHHISYRLSKSVLKPFTASSCAQVFNMLDLGQIFMNRGQTFTFETDKQVNGTFKLEVPKSVREVLGGSEGSILDTYGKGEYLFDLFHVYLYLNRGVDNNVTIRYGKNLTEFQYDSDLSEYHEAVAPYWQGTEYEDDVETSVVVTLPEGYVVADGIVVPTADTVAVSPLDLSQYFDEPPTESQLRDKAKSLLNKSKAWLIKESFDVSFARLWESGDYETYASLQRVNLCDYVTVVNPNVTGVEFKMEVIQVVYDVIEERYKSMELGSPKKNFADAVTEDIMVATDELIKSLPSKSYMQSAIDYATNLITGGLGGHVILKTNANDQPEEILIMDTDDPETAVNVWRFNLNGLGHSHSGYGGPFNDIALTMDGHINATMITTGILNAGVIRAGMLSDLLGNNWWNLDTGEIHISAGVTNLALRSKTMPTSGAYSWRATPSTSSIVEASGGGFSYANLKGQYARIFGKTGKQIKDYMNQYITVSFDIEDLFDEIPVEPVPSVCAFLNLRTAMADTTSFGDVYYKLDVDSTSISADEKKRLSVAFGPITSDKFVPFNQQSNPFNENMYIGVVVGVDNANYAKVSKIKIERGSSATDWSSALEDEDDKFMALDLSIDGLTSTVGQISNDVDSLEIEYSEISQTANRIQLEVNSMKEIGGRNLLLRSADMPTSDPTYWRITTGSSITDGVADLVPRTNSDAILAGKTEKQIKDYIGKYITLSFNVELPDIVLENGYIGGFLILRTNPGNVLYNGELYKRIRINSSDLESGKKNRVHFTYGPIESTYFDKYTSSATFNENMYFGFIINSYVSPEVYISEIQAEVGVVATDWSIAPEDDVTQWASLNVTVDGINTEVGKKVGKSEIISRINQSAEQVLIDANKITFAGKTVNFATTRINLSDPDDAGNCYFGDDSDIIIPPVVDGKDLHAIRIGGGLGYLRFGCTDIRSLVEILSGPNSIVLGNYAMESGGAYNNVLQLNADQRLVLLCGDYSIVLTSSGINFNGPNGLIDAWS